jgi:hypothetical protein
LCEGEGIWSKRCNLKSDRDINLDFPGMLLIFIRLVIFMHELPADNIEITYLLRKGTPTDAIIEVSTEAWIDLSCCSTSCSLKTLLFQYFFSTFWGFFRNCENVKNTTNPARYSHYLGDVHVFL